MSRIDDDDRKTAYQIDQAKTADVPHGVPGHIGFKCGQCARLAQSCVRGLPTDHDYWQDKQIRWQEEVDTKLREFDDSVAAHFPDHKAVDCPDCPSTAALPVKPTPPQERAVAQNARPQ